MRDDAGLLIKGTVALGVLGGAGYVLGYLCRVQRRKRPMEGGVAVAWSAPTANGEVRIVQGRGVWLQSAFYLWDEVAYAARPAAPQPQPPPPPSPPHHAAPHPPAAVSIHLVEGSAVPLQFADAEAADDLLHHLRLELYPANPFTVHLVVNPVAGGGCAEGLLATAVLPLLQASPHAVNVHVTECPGDAQAFVEADAGITAGDCVVAIGGDGTLNEVVNGVMRRMHEEPELRNRISVAVIPAGWANGAAASLGLRSAQHAAKCIARGRVSPLDIIRVTPVDPTAQCGDADAEDAACCDVLEAAAASDTGSLCGPPGDGVRYGVVGLACAALADLWVKARLLRCLGQLRYLLCVAAIVAARRVYPIELCLGGEGVATAVSHCAITSLPYVSRSALVAPSARHDSGQMTVQWLDAENTTRASLARLFLMLDAAQGGHLEASSGIRCATAEELSVTFDPECPVTLDGEAMPGLRSAKVKVLPSVLHVVVP